MLDEVDEVGASPVAVSAPACTAQDPTAATIARRFAVGLVAIIALLTATGVLLTSTGPLAGVRDWDAAINKTLAEGRTEQRVDLARFVSNSGDTRPILILLALSSIGVAITRRWRLLVIVPMAMLAEITTFLVVNWLVDRPRPTVDKIGPIPSTGSFPSGHVAATLVCWVGPAVVLYALGHQRLGRALAAIGAVFAVAMGWARVYLGMHHTLDVAFGLVLGVAALAIVIVANDMPFRQMAAPARSPSTTAA